MMPSYRPARHQWSTTRRSDRGRARVRQRWAKTDRGYRSAVRSSKLMRGECGWPPTCLEAPSFSSPCL